MCQRTRITNAEADAVTCSSRTEKSSESFIIKSLVRPVVEYACPVQSPFLIKEKLHVAKENIQ